MKIIRIYKGSGHNWTLKYDLKMKLTTLLFVVSLFTIKASTYSQNTKISLALENVSIEEVFGEIESLTDFRFFYNHRKIDVTKKVNVNAVDAQISNILNELFLHTNIYFKVRKKQIIVKTGRTPAPPVSSAPLKQELQTQIRGTVTDNTGEPLPGVNIVVQGTTTGTQTDFDGNYAISASDGDVLMFSYIGFTTQNVTVGNSPIIDVILQESTSELDEVVVVGYGTTVKKNLTSSVSSVDTDDLQVIPSTSLSNAIAGRAAGVLITTVGGRPGTTSNIVIRGAVTGAGLQGSNAPLYVIDNIIATKELFDLLDVN
ncbi:MAG: carboxypeptidase-like regulatory domain-containing protein, partial [Allomuricauda sp.]